MKGTTEAVGPTPKESDDFARSDRRNPMTWGRFGPTQSLDSAVRCVFGFARSESGVFLLRRQARGFALVLVFQQG